MLIQNPDAAEAIRASAGLTLAEGFPQNLLSNVQPVIDMTPRFHRKSIAFSDTRSTSGNLTIFTAPTGRNFALTQLNVNVIKDATCDAATGTLNVTATINKVAVVIARIPVITLTAQDEYLSIQFKNPLFIDPASTVLFSGSFSAGVMVRSGGIVGYEVYT